MVHDDPARYLSGIYDLDEKILKSLHKQIGKRFVNDTGNKKYDPFVGMIFGGQTEKPYVHFLRERGTNKMMICPRNEIMKVGDCFMTNMYDNKMITELEISNLYPGVLAEHGFQNPDFYLRLDGTIITENKV